MKHRFKIKSAAHLVSTCLFVLAGGAIAAGPASANLIVNGNFEAGNSGFSSGYSFVQACGSFGAYMIAQNPSAVCPYWVSFGDHTSGAGQMMIVDGGTHAGVDFWSENVTVNPGTEYMLTFWAASSDSDAYTKANPQVQVYINGQPVGRSLKLPPHNDGLWHEGKVRWNSGSSTTATISLVDLRLKGNGNDFAIDDISLSAF